MWVMALCIPFVAIFVQYAYKQLAYKSIIGNKTLFENCEILQYDPITQESHIVDETVTILTVENGLKLVEAETLMGAIYGLGFIHAKDRLWQMHFYRMLT